jgi:hypothetical protein
MRCIRLLCLLPIFYCAGSFAHPLEDGLAISDPEVVHLLETKGFAFSDLIALRAPNAGECKPAPGGSKNGKIFARWPLCFVATKLKERVGAAQKLSLDPTAQAEADQSTRFPIDFFDDDNATLTLVGVVNRMDRAFRPARNIGTNRAAACGEIRFIYRFGYRETIAGEFVASRLPLTLNLVMRARRPAQTEDCAAIAKRWLDVRGRLAALKSSEPAAIAQMYVDDRGPLSLLKADQIDRIEINMQILRLPASTKQDFGTHAEYLLSVFNWDRDRKIFDADVLENQIDRNLQLGDRSNAAAFRAKLAKFKKFLFSDESLFDLDRGEIIIPIDFLARSAISVAPGGSGRSQNGPLNALLGSKEDCEDKTKRQSVICLDEIDAVRKAYETRHNPLKNIKSAAGFVVRVNDISCTGCHQTRAIAGFHFTGSDRADVFAANAVFVPGSAHFFGDLPRRAAILQQIANGTKITAVNFSRGFSARPERRFETALQATTLLDGWGAACNLKAGHDNADKSFSDWTCGPGLTCTSYMPSAQDPDRGICAAPAPAAEIGDPLEYGDVKTYSFGSDEYHRDEPNKVQGYLGQDTSLNIVDGKTLAQRLHLPQGPPADRFVAAQQEAFTKRGTGGFPGGMLRTECCERLPTNATCGQVAVDGFNNCLDNKTMPFTKCFENFVNYAGLRACDAATPCREDYICLRPMLNQIDVQKAYQDLKPLDRQYSCAKPDDKWLPRANMGTCIPPYFVLQFRADKHHTTTVAEPGRN